MDKEGRVSVFLLVAKKIKSWTENIVCDTILFSTARKDPPTAQLSKCRQSLTRPALTLSTLLPLPST